MNNINMNGVADQSSLTGENGAHLKQIEPPAYLVAAGTVFDPATFNTYAQQIPRTLAPFGGHFLVGGGKIEALEGTPPKFTVIIAFESLEKANAWWSSPAYEAIKPIRHASSKAQLFFVEGVPAE
jgi:uncharacterized protein (DUF1330 family)